MAITVNQLQRAIKAEEDRRAKLTPEERAAEDKAHKAKMDAYMKDFSRRYMPTFDMVSRLQEQIKAITSVNESIHAITKMNEQFAQIARASMPSFADMVAIQSITGFNELIDQITMPELADFASLRKMMAEISVPHDLFRDQIRRTVAEIAEAVEAAKDDPSREPQVIEETVIAKLGAKCAAADLVGTATMDADATIEALQRQLISAMVWVLVAVKKGVTDSNWHGVVAQYIGVVVAVLLARGCACDTGGTTTIINNNTTIYNVLNGGASMPAPPAEASSPEATSPPQQVEPSSPSATPVSPRAKSSSAKARSSSPEAKKPIPPP
jgi:hypothetical protein